MPEFPLDPLPDPDIETRPMTAVGHHGSVVVSSVGGKGVCMTADAAEQSGLLMIDAAMKAREHPFN